MMAELAFPLLVIIAFAETNEASTKVVLQGYLTGQLNSGSNQAEAWRREFKTFTDYIEKSVKSMKAFKEKAEVTLLKIQGILIQSK